MRKSSITFSNLNLKPIEKRKWYLNIFWLGKRYYFEDSKILYLHYQEDFTFSSDQLPILLVKELYKWYYDQKVNYFPLDVFPTLIDLFEKIYNYYNSQLGYWKGEKVV